VTYLETGKAAQAVPVLRSRLQDHPDDANLNYLYAEALLRAGAQPGEPAYLEAQNRLQKSITIDPKLVEPHVSLGKIYLNENRVNDAVHQFELARSIDPNSKAACAHLAVGYRKLGQSEKARAILLELRAINDQERTGSRVESRAPGQTAETNAHSPS
jgi:Flp pilus assembly protein TadD